MFKTIFEAFSSRNQVKFRVNLAIDTNIMYNKRKTTNVKGKIFLANESTGLSSKPWTFMKKFLKN